jgi:lipopolysaccharide/colanic/teichoic acid biosynthesis glycosyltransferase
MKRTLDFLGAAIGLVLFSPLLAYIVWRIGRDLGSPTIFRQTRPGKHGVAFQMVKFRTMQNAYGSDGTLLPDAERISPLGTKLRSTSLDELPEFWNVLKGEMSLVGPRPLLMEYLPLYNSEQARRHEVRPGITGWAQVNGRNAISWEEKFALDVWYVDNRTIWLDLKIILMTVKKVLIREGISAEGEATMSKFEGQKKDISQ